MPTGQDIAAIMQLDSRFRAGGMEFRHPPAHVQIVAANTSTTIFRVTPNFTAWLVGIHVANRNTASTLITIGTGDFTQVLPTIGPIIAGFDEMIWLMPTDFEQNDIVARASAAAAANNEVEIMAYVLQLMGS